MSDSHFSHQYLAFISYRHADNKQTGRQWATWLHQAIETYEIPKDLVGQKNARGETIPERIFPIFRDEEELPADADLANAITRALDNTGLLIVLCSPNAVASTYVADEIDYFKKLGRSDQIIAAMIAGEPNASWDTSKQKQGFTIEDECFPTPLQYAYDEHGEPTTQLAEPLAADFRVNHDGVLEQGWASIEAYRQYLKSLGTVPGKVINERVANYQTQQQLMLLKIIAGIIGVPLGALTKRDQAYQLELAQQKAKRLRQWLSGVALLALVAIVAGVLAFFAQQRAVKNEQLATQQRDASLLNQSRFLMDRARQANDDGEHDIAILLGLNALPGLYGGDRPMLGDIGQLRRAIYANNKVFHYSSPEKIEQVKFFGEQTIYTLTNGKLLLISVTEEGLDKQLESDQPIQAFALNKQRDRLVTASEQGTVTLWDLASLSAINSISVDADINSLVISPDAKTVYMTSLFERLIAWSVDKEEIIYDIKHSQQFTSGDLQLSGDGQYLLMTPEVVGEVRILNAADGQLIRKPTIGFNYLSNHSIARKTQFTADSKSVLIYDLNGTRVENIMTGQAQGVTLNIHTIMNSSGEYLLAMATSQQVQSSAENADFVRSLENAPTLWNIKTNLGGQLSHFSKVDDAAFTPNGKLLITLSYNNVRVWDVSTGTELNSFKINKRMGLTLTNSQLLSVSDEEKAISIWQLLNDKPSFTLDENLNLWRAAFSQNGQLIAAVNSNKEHLVNIYFSKSGQLKTMLTLCENAKFDSNDLVNAKRYILIKCGFNNPRVYDLTNNKWLTFDGEQFDNISDIKIIENQNTALLIKDSWREKSLYLVELNSGKLMSEFPLDQDTSLNSVSLSDDAQYVMLGNNKAGVTLVDLKTQESLFQTKEISRIIESAFISDTARLALRTDKRVINILDTHTGNQLKQLTFSSDITAMLVKGSELIIGLKEAAVVRIESETGQEIARFNTVEKAAELSLTVSGKYLIVNNGRPSIYELATGKLFYQSDNFQDQNIAFDEKNDRLVLLSNQGKLFNLPAMSSQIIDAAINVLPKRQYCLSKKQRDDNFMSPLSELQTQQRNCSLMK